MNSARVCRGRASAAMLRKTPAALALTKLFKNQVFNKRVCGFTDKLFTLTPRREPARANSLRKPRLIWLGGEAVIPRHPPGPH
jgi:hypothetical protein